MNKRHLPGSLFVKSQLLLEFDKIIQLVINYAVSDQAKLTLEQLIYEPFVENIQFELDLLEELTEVIGVKALNLINFEPIESDLTKLKIPGIEVSVDSILRLRKVLINNQEILRFASDPIFQNYKHFLNFVSLLPDLNKPLHAINKIVDFNGLIRDDASLELLSIRESIQKLNRSLYSTFKRELDLYKVKSYLAEGDESIRNGRYVLRVQAEHKRKIPGMLVGESDSGKTAFIEPQVCFELNNKLTELNLDEQREISKILANLGLVLRPFIEHYKVAFNQILATDILLAKAHYAKSIQAVKPTLNENKLLQLVTAFHPLLINKFQKLDKLPVPMNIRLDETQRILLISGPNAGGKTLVLKTVGLLQLMLQKGFLIPVSKKSNICLFKKIWVDIGDWQSLDEGLSTYSAKLAYMKKLVNEADKTSLVLMDELGSGTEPKIGGAIAEAVLSELLNLKATGIISTHYSNLKSFAHVNKGIQNGSMLYDETKMTPLYKLQIGKPGSSYALDIAKKMHFPKKLIKYAKEKVGNDIIKMEDLLSKMEEEKRNLEASVLNYKNKIDSLNKLIKAYEAMQKQYELKRLKLKMDSKHVEFQQNLEIKKENNNILNEIRSKLDFAEAQKQLELSKTKVKEVAGELNQAESEYFNLVKSSLPNHQIKPGDKVFLIKHGMSGIVDEINDKRAKIVTDFFTVELNVNELVFENQSLIVEKKPNVNIQLVDKVATLSGTIDLRGQKVEHAIQALEDYLDQALLTSLKTAKILHGKGSGVLKTAIHKQLKKFKFVQSFYHPEEEEGGAGITIVAFN
ncbi:MAG TPA: Smr/MutS family protein [Saprospiraceae bacterium]|nr:Smr/MutS family protein [Saprospiraceae bacterium]